MAKLTPKIVVGDWNSVAHAIAKLDQALNSGAAPTFRGLTLTGTLNMTGHPITDLGYIDFDTTASPGDGSEGRTKWNAMEHTLDLTTGLGPVLQVGQESFVLVYNGTGSTIYNGTAVYPMGAVAGRPSIHEASANTHVTFGGVVLVTTMDIPTGTVGIVSKDGKVRGIDTSGFSLGDRVYLSKDGEGIVNNLTNVRPSFPSYAIQIGGVTVEDGSDGVIQLEVKGGEQDTIQNYWNGTFREPFDFRVTESAGTVTGTVTPTNGHPDLTMMFSDGFQMLDTDPGATIDITAYVGTDIAPLTCYIFIPQSTKILTVDTSWPIAEHIRIAQLFLQSAVTTGTSGALRNQNWNDEIQDTDTNQGHLSHIGHRIRSMASEWDSGVEAVLTVADTANSYVSVTSGEVFQMHLQTIPAQAMPTDNMEVVNDPDAAYTPITTLNSITKTSEGVTISNNRWFSIVVWSVCNKSGERSHLMCNVPAGFYTSESNAQMDTLGYANYTIPKEFKGVGFLVARFTVQRKASTIAYGGGDSYQDLRGFIPNSTAGSGAGGSGITTFLGLVDTPTTFVGQGLKFPQVNVGETALEFVSITADHGELSGLSDDDHSQYHTDARAATWLGSNQSLVDHNAITNAHNLTTDIDHATITNAHNLTTDIDHDQLTNTHNLTTNIDHATITNAHNLTTDIDHDALTNFVTDEHIDWKDATANFKTTGTGYFAGDVGIGIEVPLDTLHIRGTNAVVHMDSTSGNGVIKINCPTDSESVFSLRENGSERWRIGLDGDDANKFKIGKGSFALNTKVTITTLGQFGIGVPSPPTILSIDGSLSFKERADHETILSGFAQLWVKNTGNGQLWFTDDAGNDTQIV